MARTAACSWHQTFRISKKWWDGGTWHHVVDHAISAKHHPSYLCKSSDNIDLVLYGQGDARLVILSDHVSRFTKSTTGITWGHHGASKSQCPTTQQAWSAAAQEMVGNVGEEPFMMFAYPKPSQYPALILKLSLSTRACTNVHVRACFSSSANLGN